MRVSRRMPYALPHGSGAVGRTPRSSSWTAVATRKPASERNVPDEKYVHKQPSSPLPARNARNSAAPNSLAAAAVVLSSDPAESSRAPAPASARPRHTASPKASKPGAAVMKTRLPPSPWGPRRNISRSRTLATEPAARVPTRRNAATVVQPQKPSGARPTLRWNSAAVMRRGVLRSREEFGEILKELTLALGPDESLHRLALVEHHQCRDAHHVVAHRRLRVVVDVELDNAQLALVLGGDLLERRRDHLARTAPLGPEIDEDGRFRAPDRLVERVVRKIRHVGAHEGPFGKGR